MRSLTILLLIGMCAVITGCNGMVKDYEERENMYAEGLDADLRQLTDDVDTFLLANRQSRLTRWNQR